MSRKRPKYRSGSAPGRPSRLSGLRLALVAATGIAIGIAIYAAVTWIDGLDMALREATANSSRLLLRGLGWGVSLDGTTLVVPSARLLVSTECTSLGATAFLWGALLAFPAPWSGKGLGLLVGAAALFVVNAVRVVTLVYVSAYAPAWLDVAHLLVWQTLMVVLALALFLLWTQRFALSHTR